MLPHSKVVDMSIHNLLKFWVRIDPRFDMNNQSQDSSMLFRIDDHHILKDKNI
jgi:hypothetical protein